jgi:hypothetical protein
MNESRKKEKCNCLDDEPRKCYELQLLKIGEKTKDIPVQHLCSCSCHADQLGGEIDQIKGRC